MQGMLQQHIAATCSDKTCIHTEAICSRDVYREHIASRLAKISILVPLSWAALGIFFLLPFEILFTSAIRYKCTCPYVCLFFFFVFEDGYSNATKFDLNYQFSVFIDTSLAFFKKFAFFCSNIFQCNIVPFPW